MHPTAPPCGSRRLGRSWVVGSGLRLPRPSGHSQVNGRHRMHRTPSCWPPALAALQATHCCRSAAEQSHPRARGRCQAHSRWGGRGQPYLRVRPQAGWVGPEDVLSVAGFAEARGHAALSVLPLCTSFRRRLYTDLGLKRGRNGHLSAGLWLSVTTCAVRALHDGPFRSRWGGFGNTAEINS